MEGDGGGFPYYSGVDGVHCPRCGLYYPSKYSECLHCAELSDVEAREYGEQFRNEVNHTSRPLAKFFLWSVVAVLMLMIIIVTGS